MNEIPITIVTTGTIIKSSPTQYEENFGATMPVEGSLVMNQEIDYGVKMGSEYHFECFDKDGNLKWEERVKNRVVTTGLNQLITETFKNGTIAAWYCGIKGAGSIVAGDTMASHAGWSEITKYGTTLRPVLTLGSVASGTANNSASKASYSINGTTIVAGGFVATTSLRGNATGTLYGATDFSSARGVINGDTLNVTITISCSTG